MCAGIRCMLANLLDYYCLLIYCICETSEKKTRLINRILSNNVQPIQSQIGRQLQDTAEYDCISF